MRTVENISVEEWEQIVDQFIQQDPDDSQFNELSAEQFFSTWEQFEASSLQPPTEIQIEVSKGHIRLIPSPTGDIATHENWLRMPDGRELVFTLFEASSEET